MNNFIRSRRASVTRYNSETLTYRDNIIANAGTISPASLLAADAFVTQCKATGIWPKLLDVGLFMGDQLAAALVKMISGSGGPTLTNVNFVGGDYHENAGLQGDGATKYLRTGELANAAGIASVAFYNRTAVDSAATRTMIGSGATDNNFIGLQHSIGGADVFEFGLSAAPVHQPNAAGLYTGTVPSAGQISLYLGSALVGDIEMAVAAPNIATEFYVFAHNEAGAAAEWWSGLGSFYAIGTALTAADALNLYAAVNQLQTALNRNV
jgi:hypothetical protein